MEELFRSVLEQDRAPVVLCNTEHVIVYMNPAAKKRYGADLTGRSLFDCHTARANAMIEKIVAWFRESPSNNMIYTFRNDEENKDVYMTALRDGGGALLGYYEKHEYRDRETAALYDFGHPVETPWRLS